jgi:large subunit ribosomal protein L21
MYAIVETGGKQYRVEEKAVIAVERLDAPVGETVELDRVLLVRTDGKVHVGKPLVRGAKVICRMLGQEKARKIVVFKYKAKKNYRRKTGHRQEHSRLLVEKIMARAPRARKAEGGEAEPAGAEAS